MQSSIVLDMKRSAVRKRSAASARRILVPSDRCCTAPARTAAISVCWSMRCPAQRCSSMSMLTSADLPSKFWAKEHRANGAAVAVAAIVRHSQQHQ